MLLDFPNWKFGDKDGGEGHIGTVISVKDDNTAEVVWDNGNQVTCKIGKDRQKDLRVIDNAPAGSYENTIPASSTTKTGRHDIAEILLKVALNTKYQSISSLLLSRLSSSIKSGSHDIPEAKYFRTFHMN
jgi:hypothetical protein